MSKDNEPLEDEDERGVRDPELLADLGCRWIDGELILEDFFYWNFLRLLKHSNSERGLVDGVESEIRRTFCVLCCVVFERKV